LTFQKRDEFDKNKASHPRGHISQKPPSERDLCRIRGNGNQRKKKVTKDGPGGLIKTRGTGR